MRPDSKVIVLFAALCGFADAGRMSLSFGDRVVAGLIVTAIAVLVVATLRLRRHRADYATYITLPCKLNDCSGEITFGIEPFVPGYISGPPEKCYEDEGGFAEQIHICSQCGRDATNDDKYLAYEQYEADCRGQQEDAAADLHYDPPPK